MQLAGVQPGQGELVVLIVAVVATVYHLYRMLFGGTPDTGVQDEKRPVVGEPPPAAPASVDRLREVITGLIAAALVIGGFLLIALVPTAPRDIVTMSIGAIIGYYFTRTT